MDSPAMSTARPPYRCFVRAGREPGSFSSGAPTMILANVTFGGPPKNTTEDLEDIAERYLGSLFQAGQICGEYFLTWTNGRLNAHVALAGGGALSLRYHSDSGKQDLERIVAVFGRRPIWKMLDDNARQRSPSWKRSSFLYLFTHAWDWASPVCRGDDGAPIPLFLLPISFHQKADAYSWQKSYRHHDSIWLGSAALEIPAYRQLADPDSELSQRGRELCRELESATGVPVFYYLMRYWGRTPGEKDRRCPGCGRRWNVKKTADESERFCKFDFRCERCRLVSHLGVSFDGGRHIRIGEFTAGAIKGHRRRQRTK